MNDNAKKWVEALRSGVYKQAKEALRDSDSFCCLGVACDISGLGVWNGNDEYEIAAWAINDVLPQPVRRWLGLATDDGTMASRVSLVSLNDDGKSFEQIASLIESEPEGLFS